MTIPRSVRLKLLRVDDHLTALDEAISEFLATEPYAAHRVVEKGGAEHVILWDRYTPPPENLGLIAGDAIHNLRSSLDHLVVALATAGAESMGVVLTPREERRLQFPICQSRDAFDQQVSGGRLTHVAKEARQLIEVMQPYNVSTTPEMSNLWLVNELDNADKHRSLTLTALNVGVVQHNWPFGVATDWRPATLGRDPGAEMGRYVCAAPVIEEEAPVEFRWGIAIFTVHHWRWADVREVLHQYVQVVTDLITELADRFLP